MAKRLPMNDLIKKYQFVKTNQQNLIEKGTTQTGNETDRKTNDELSKYSSSYQTSSSNVPEESKTAMNAEDACKVCLDAEANCAFIECGHIVSCLACAKMLTRCPVCRQTIKRTLRIYKS